jgi:hypothetical protein
MFVSEPRLLSEPQRGERAIVGEWTVLKARAVVWKWAGLVVRAALGERTVPKARVTRLVHGRVGGPLWGMSAPMYGSESWTTT